MLEKPAELFDRLEQSGLLSPSIIERRDALLGTESAEKAADELVRLNLLTEYQARVAVKDGSVPLSIGDYLVEDQIGRGGMGFVLKARNRRMKRQVAIKFLHKSMTQSPDLVARFEREVEAAAQLHHQNIVTAYDAGEHDGSHYLVMQYVDGEDLSHRVKRDGPLRVSEAIDVIRQAAEGLGYAHEKGIVHRDIKPGNLLLDREGVVRILDMGLARMRPSPGDALDGGAHADLTNTGSVMGTVDYMAPEQALDAKTADFSADIYSLGCTLYFLLTGNPPFRSDTIMRRLLAHREQDIPLISHVRPEAPSELDQVFAKMMAKKKEDRYPSMQHLVVALKSIELDDAEAEQMATIDAPDDGTGGFIKLPEADHLDNSDEQSAFNDSSPTAPTGSRVFDTASSAADATLIESDSQLSNTVVVGDADSLAQGESFSEAPSTTSPPESSQQSSNRTPGNPPWKIIIPGISAVLVIAVLFAISQNGTDESETLGPLADAESQSSSQATAPGTATPDTRSLTGTAVPGSDEMSPDRRAAEWVLSIGGTVLVSVGQQNVTATEQSQLPDRPFLVVGVDLFSNPRVTDEGLTNLQGLSGLRSLVAWDTSISDAGLANLTDSGKQALPNLSTVHLQMTRISDSGLSYLVGSPIDNSLLIAETDVSDPDLLRKFAEVRHLNIGLTGIPVSRLDFLEDFHRLAVLNLDARQWNALAAAAPQFAESLTQVSVFDRTSTRVDERLLKRMPHMVSLTMNGPPAIQFDEAFWTALAAQPEFEDLRLDAEITDEALTHLQRMPRLRTLHLDSTTISGKALAKAAQQLSGLKTLKLTNGQLTDYDVSGLTALTTLQQFEVKGNQITADGIATLRQALPGCRIISDHGTFEPDPGFMSPDRRAAEWVLSIGGSIGIDTPDGTKLQVEDRDELPDGPFVLRNVGVQNIPALTDDGLINLRGCSQLASLHAYDTAITDQGLANLTDEGRQPLRNLASLFIARTAVTEKGLEHLAESGKLKYLDIESNPVSDGSVLGQFRELETINIALTKIPAEDLSTLQDLPGLWQLSVDGPQLQGAGGRHVSSLSNLKSLLIRYPGAGFDGVVLRDLKGLTTLHVLELPERRLDDLLWSAVAGLPRLDDLYLDGDGVTDASIGKMPALSKLRVLKLKNVQKQLRGETVSAAVLRAPALEELVVSNNELSDVDAKQLESLTQLTRLTLTGNEITSAAIASLHQALPGCRIISDHGTFEPTGPTSNWALSFDGKDDYVELPLTYDFSHPITLEVWARPEALSTHPNVLGNRDGPYKGLTLKIDTRSGRNHWGLMGNQTDNGPVAADGRLDSGQTSKVRLNEWVHLAGTWDGHRMQFFVNGKGFHNVFVRDQQIDDGVAIQIQESNATFALGGRQNFFNGDIRGVRISNNVRYARDFEPPQQFQTDEYTLAVYDFSRGTGEVLSDVSGNGHDGTIHGARWIATRTHHALKFQADGDAVLVDSLAWDGTSPRTVEGWIIPDADAGPVFNQQGPRELKLASLDDSPNWMVSFTKAGEQLVALSPRSVTASGRLHVATTFDGQEPKLWLNGRLATDSPRSVSHDLDRKAIEPAFVIGAHTSWNLKRITSSFRGVIDEVRVSDVVRYDSSFTPPDQFEADEHTLALYHFDEGQGTVLKDSSNNGHDGAIRGAKWIQTGDVSELPTAPRRDRAAAEWILKHDGNVIVKMLDSSKSLSVKAGETLPDSPFHLTQINLNKLAPEDEFANLAGLTELEGAFINYFPLTDAALENLKDSKKLRSLHVEGTQITDGGLDILAHFPSLESLQISAGFTDEGLQHVLQAKQLKRLSLGFKSNRPESLGQLSELARLESLALSYADLTSNDSGQGGLDFLQRLSGLVSLRIGRCMIDVPCLRELSKQEHLRELTLHQNSVEPDSLRELGKFQHLETLTVVDSELTDADVALFTGLTGLKSLNINRNAFSPDGIATLRKSLPGCRLESDHGTFEPAVEPDRRAAEWILKHGGAVVVRPLSSDEETRIDAGEKLPPAPFHLIRIYLKKQAPEDEFSALAGLESLEFAGLNYFPLTDAALANLKDSVNLRALHLEATKITDTGLSVLAHFPLLETLRLPDGISEEGLQHVLKLENLKNFRTGYTGDRTSLQRLRELSQLEYLSLNYVDVRSAESGTGGLSFIRALPKLTSLRLYQCRIDAQSLQELAELKHLRELFLHQAAVDPDALQELRKFSHLNALTVPKAGLKDGDVDLFTELAGLKQLNVIDNEFSPEGIVTLRKSLPGCRIESDHGTFGASQ